MAASRRCVTPLRWRRRRTLTGPLDPHKRTLRAARPAVAARPHSAGRTAPRSWRRVRPGMPGPGRAGPVVLMDDFKCFKETKIGGTQGRSKSILISASKISKSFCLFGVSLNRNFMLRSWMRGHLIEIRLIEVLIHHWKKRIWNSDATKVKAVIWKKISPIIYLISDIRFWFRFLKLSAYFDWNFLEQWSDFCCIWISDSLCDEPWRNTLWSSEGGRKVFCFSELLRHFGR